MKIIRLPGLIDIHVHLRDPGETHKEDFFSGTRAALAGGITAVFDMPNNKVPVFTRQVLDEKIKIAKAKAVSDWGLYFGSTGDNIGEFASVADKVVGLKVYLSKTTGKYVVGDDDKVEYIVKNWPREKIIVFHAEGAKVELVINLLEKYGRKMHITHVSTIESLEKIIAAKKDNLPLTCDVTPHHLFLTEGDCKRGPSPQGTVPGLYVIKPALATKKDQDFLWSSLSYIDCFASDHAPHLLSEKKTTIPPSGVPGIETMLSLFLTSVKQKRIGLDDLINKLSLNPCKIFDLKQEKSTYVEVDLEEEYRIENKNLLTKCGWSPYDGWKISGRIKNVYIRGTKVFENGKLLVPQGFGNNID